MQVINWNESNLDFLSSQTGISIGSFDGLHKGHRVLLNSLVQNCKKNNLKSGVVTFYRPLPSIKHSSDYAGDISTLQQR
jgi:FAD synthase